MRADQIEALRTQRATLAHEVQALHDTPAEQRPTGANALKSWLRRLEDAQAALRRLDSLLERIQRAETRADRQATLAQRLQADEQVVLGTIPKGIGAEVRVTLQTWKGRRTVDVRCYAAPPEDGEMRPTRKGLQIDVKRLPALLDALKKAQEFV